MPEPTDTPPPGYGPVDTPPTDFRAYSRALRDRDGIRDREDGGDPLGEPVRPSPMDEPLIPDLPAVPTFPDSTGPTHDTSPAYDTGGALAPGGTAGPAGGAAFPDDGTLFGGGYGGPGLGDGPLDPSPGGTPPYRPYDSRPDGAPSVRTDALGPTERFAPGAGPEFGTQFGGARFETDPRGGGFPDPLTEPTDTPPPGVSAPGSRRMDGSLPAGPAPTGTDPAAGTAPGPATAAAAGSSTGQDQPVLPFSETTAFFQRPTDPSTGGEWSAAYDRPDTPSYPADARDTGSASVDSPASGRGRRSKPAPEGGVPGWAAITISLACTGAAILADLTLTRSIGVLFGLCFVLTAFGIAAGVRRTAMFTAGVLPPLSALAGFVVLGAAAPERFVGEDGGLLRIGSAIMSGLASSAWFLVAAWAVALGTLALRTARKRPHG